MLRMIYVNFLYVRPLIMVFNLQIKLDHAIKIKLKRVVRVLYYEKYNIFLPLRLTKSDCFSLSLSLSLFRLNAAEHFRKLF